MIKKLKLICSKVCKNILTSIRKNVIILQTNKGTLCLVEGGAVI